MSYNKAHRIGRKIAGSILCLIFILSVSCTDRSKFKLTGDTTDGREITFRVFIYAPEGVRSDVVGTRSGHFEYKGSVWDEERPVYIEFYTHDYKLLGLAEVKGGEELKIKLDPEGIAGFRTTDSQEKEGNPFGEALNKWLGSTKNIDNEAVEKFVKAHSDESVAFAVLTTLYNGKEDAGKADELLEMISADARPGYYDNGFGAFLDGERDRPAYIEKAEMLCAADTFFVLNPKDYKSAIIVFTTDDAVRSDSVVPLLYRLGEKAKRKKMLVLEHNLSADTLTWRRMLRSDVRALNKDDEKKIIADIRTTDNIPEREVSYRKEKGGGDKSVDKKNEKNEKKVNWVSVWTGVGVASPVAERYNITDLPYYVVADSSAIIRYAGLSAAEAEAELKKIAD